MSPLVSRRQLLTAGVGLAAGSWAGALVAAPAAPAAVAPVQVLRVAIAVPLNHGHRSLPRFGEQNRFPVVLTNTGDRPLRLWRDWCSWGYFNLTFETMDAQGKTQLIRKVERGWDKNYPDFLELEAGDQTVLDVSFRADVWSGLPDLASLKQNPAQFDLRAIFNIEPDQESVAHKVWTGRVESPWRKYSVW